MTILINDELHPRTLQGDPEDIIRDLHQTARFSGTQFRQEVAERVEMYDGQEVDPDDDMSFLRGLARTGAITILNYTPAER